MQSILGERYVFHGGRERALSQAELRARFGEAIDTEGELGWLPTETTEVKPEELLKELGGCVKISRTLEQIPLNNDERAIAVAQALLRVKPEGKLAFGVSFFPENKSLFNFLKKVKTELKTHGRNARFANQHTNTDSPTIAKGGLLKEGTDLNVIQRGGKTWLTQTVAVQDFAGYSLRDYEKPVRLQKEGMLPPKLAQLMINLSGLAQSRFPHAAKTLYDPFCGSGTVLGEARLKGLDVIGSDLDPIAIDAAQKNLTWLSHRFPESSGSITLFQKDARALIAADLPTSPDLVVSEVYLGPPCTTRTTATAIANIQRDLMELYKETFDTLKKTLRPGTPLVMAFPVHFVNRKPQPLPDLETLLQTAGFEPHGHWTYHRKDQIVGRDIWVLKTV